MLQSRLIKLCVSNAALCLEQKGFGNIDGEHWLGLENIYNLATQGNYRLMVELEDWSGKKVYAEYSSFRLEPESEGYRLRLGTYQGNAGDSLASHNGKPFTTLDRDKDSFSGTDRTRCRIRCSTESLNVSRFRLSPSPMFLLSPQQATAHTSTKAAGGTMRAARRT